MNLRRAARITILSLLPLTALADGERQPYTCDNASRLDLSFATPADGRPQATLHFADGNLTLPQVPTPSGVLYRQDDIRLHIDGEQALFEDGKGNRRLCRRGDTPPPTSAVANPAAASSFLDIGGTVRYPVDRPLPAGAVLVVFVRDGVGGRSRLLAEQRIELTGQAEPVAFATSIDRDLIGKNARVTVTARIEAHGRVLFASRRAVPALSDGQALPVALDLHPASRAAPR